MRNRLPASRLNLGKVDLRNENAQPQRWRMIFE